jgi:hypothetical protein
VCALQLQVAMGGEKKASTFSFFATLLAVSDRLVLSWFIRRCKSPGGTMNSWSQDRILYSILTPWSIILLENLTGL